MAKQKFAASSPSRLACGYTQPSPEPTPTSPPSSCLSTFIGAAHLHRINLIINMATGQVAGHV